MYYTLTSNAGNVALCEALEKVGYLVGANLPETPPTNLFISMIDLEKDDLNKHLKIDSHGISLLAIDNYLGKRQLFKNNDGVFTTTIDKDVYRLGHKHIAESFGYSQCSFADYVIGTTMSEHLIKQPNNVKLDIFTAMLQDAAYMDLEHFIQSGEYSDIFENQPQIFVKHCIDIIGKPMFESLLRSYAKGRLESSNVLNLIRATCDE